MWLFIKQGGYILCLINYKGKASMNEEYTHFSLDKTENFNSINQGLPVEAQFYKMSTYSIIIGNQSFRCYLSLVCLLFDSQFPICCRCPGEKGWCRGWFRTAWFRRSEQSSGSHCGCPVWPCAPCQPRAEWPWTGREQWSDSTGGTVGFLEPGRTAGVPPVSASSWWDIDIQLQINIIFLT